MKKFIFVLFCFVSFSHYSYAAFSHIIKDKELDITVWEGESFSVDIYNQLTGFSSRSISSVRKSSTTMNLPESAFEETKEKHVTTYKYPNSGLYPPEYKGYCYTLTEKALKSGVYKVKIGMDYVYNYYSSSKKCYVSGTDWAYITLKITVKHIPVVTEIKLPSEITILVGGSYTYKPQILEAGAKTTLTWSSSNTSVATVNNNGVVMGKKAGYAYIYCRAGNGISTKVKIIVNPVKASSLMLNLNKLNLYVDDSYQLKVTLSPTNVTDKNVKWASSNSAIVAVTSDGLVYGMSVGKAVITATTKDGTDISASCLVSVNEKPIILANKINIIEKNYSMSTDTEHQFSAKLSPFETTNKNIHWEVSDSQIATISKNGVLVPKKYGRIYVYAKTTDGSLLSDSCLVTLVQTVKQNITSLIIEKQDIEIPLEKKYQIQIKTTPENAPNVVYKSDNTQILAVNSDGVIVPKREGEAKVYIETIDGSKIARVINVKVLKSVSSDISNLQIDADIPYGYDLMGRKVDVQNRHGIFVINGKKVYK